MRNGYIIDTLTSVGSRETANIGGKKFELLKGWFIVEILRYLQSENLQKSVCFKTKIKRRA